MFLSMEESNLISRKVNPTFLFFPFKKKKEIISYLSYFRIFCSWKRNRCPCEEHRRVQDAKQEFDCIPSFSSSLSFSFFPFLTNKEILFFLFIIQRYLEGKAVPWAIGGEFSSHLSKSGDEIS